jgi:hypothetical protein
MSKRERQRHPVVEGFEARALLSVGMGGPSSVAAAVGNAPDRSLRLNGTLHGHYVVISPLPDVAKTYDTSGSGRLHGIGRASLNGSLRSLGNVAQGVAEGDITLVRPGGTITIHLTGSQQQGGPIGPPGTFNFGITAATGKFRSAHGSGSASLTLVPEQGGVGTLSGEQGSFTIVLSPRALPV